MFAQEPNLTLHEFMAEEMRNRHYVCRVVPEYIFIRILLRVYRQRVLYLREPLCPPFVFTRTCLFHFVIFVAPRLFSVSFSDIFRDEYNFRRAQK